MALRSTKIRPRHAQICATYFNERQSVILLIMVGISNLGIVRLRCAVEMRKASQHLRARVEQAVNFEEDHPRIDQAAILEVVDLPPVSESADRYRSSTARRGATRASCVIKQFTSAGKKRNERCIASTATSLTCGACCK